MIKGNLNGIPIPTAITRIVSTGLDDLLFVLHLYTLLSTVAVFFD